MLEDGFGRLTIEAVAARSGVGKPTIYRNWANSSELAMAALMLDITDQKPDSRMPFFEALAEQLDGLVAAFSTTRGRQIALTLAASDPESEMTKAFRNRVILSSREGGRRLIEDARARGDIKMTGNIDVVLDMIYAPLFYRLLVGHAPLDQAFATDMTQIARTLLSP